MKLRADGNICGEQVAVGDCEQKNVRVCVDGVEIPTVDQRGEDQSAVEVQVRKDGPGKLTRISDVYFPAHWKGEDIFSYLPFGENENSVPVKISARPPDGGEWQTLHYGWLRKIGSGGDGRLMRMRVDDYVKILQSTYVSQQFRGAGSVVTPDTVFSFIENELIRQKGIEMSVIDENFQVQRPAVERGEADVPTGVQRNVPANVIDRNTFAINNVKTFQSNRDTLVDVLDWLVGQIDGGYWYVGADDDGPAIVVGRNLDPTWTSVEAGGRTVIRKNMAMEDINPVNSVRVIGQTGFSIFGKNIDLFSTPSSEYPIAEATHTSLYRRANFVKHSKKFEVEETTEDGAAAKARQLLEEEIEGASESSMVLNGNPSIIPHGTIYARPVCNEYVDADVPVIGYGIERVIHEIPATGLFTTEISVGIQVQSGSIEITEKTMANSTGEETDDDIFSEEDLDEEEILRANLP